MVNKSVEIVQDRKVLVKFDLKEKKPKRIINEYDSNRSITSYELTTEKLNEDFPDEENQSKSKYENLLGF